MLFDGHGWSRMEMENEKKDDGWAACIIMALGRLGIYNTMHIGMTTLTTTDNSPVLGKHISG